MSPRSEKQRLKDILESIEKIGVAEVALAEAEAAAELEVVQMAFLTPIVQPCSNWRSS